MKEEEIKYKKQIEEFQNYVRQKNSRQILLHECSQALTEIKMKMLNYVLHCNVLHCIVLITF